MKVMVVSSKYPPEYSGSGVRAHNTYRRLARKFGVAFEVLADSAIYNDDERYEIDGVSVFRVPSRFQGSRASRIRRAAGSWATLFRVFQYLLARHREFDVIHAFGRTPVTSAAVSYAKWKHKPLMVELVNATPNPDMSESRLLSSLLGTGYPPTAQIVCLSGSLREACLARGYTAQQLWTRPNPVDETVFNFDDARRNGARQRLTRFGADDIVILHLAKFIPRKNQLFAVETLCRLPNQFKLLLVGPLERTGPLSRRDRDYLEEIQRFISDNNLGSRVQIIPQFVENPRDYVDASDIFIAPAVDEAFGTPFAEALACGAPVVANAGESSFRQWIVNGQNGYLTRLNHEEWARDIAAAALIQRESMRAASRAILEEASTAVIDQAYYDRLVALSGVA